MVVRGYARQVDYLGCWGWVYGSGRQGRAEAVGVTVEAPVSDGGSGPVDVGVEPWYSQNYRVQR